MRRIHWGDEHVQKSSVVNVAHVDPTISAKCVAVPFWQLVALVAMNGFQWGAIIALVVSR